MSQSDTDKAAAAQERSRETESFVRTVKSATRRRYTPEEKIRILLEGFRREVTVSDLCRREGIRPHSYYRLEMDHGLRTVTLTVLLNTRPFSDILRTALRPLSADCR